VGTVAVVVIDELSQESVEVTRLMTIRWSRHSLRIERTTRSAMAFAFGDRGGVLTVEIPSVAARSPKCLPLTASRSQMRCHGRRPHGVASISWRLI
jgi:hypothetical protein